MTAPAPGLLSTITGCPSALFKGSPSMRLVRSALPPAGNGTMMRSGLDGNVWACAAPAAKPIATAAAVHSAFEEIVGIRKLPRKNGRGIVAPFAGTIGDAPLSPDVRSEREEPGSCFRYASVPVISNFGSPYQGSRHREGTCRGRSTSPPHQGPTAHCIHHPSTSRVGRDGGSSSVTPPD